MIRTRKASERGHANHGWLNARHSFSFGRYHDPRWMGFGPLRVINDDRIAPGRGFAEHPHAEMEIITIVLEGALAHADSTGSAGVLRRGDIQRMTAGTGIRHSEKNASTTEPIRLLQIWIEPATPGLAPGYEQRAFPESDRSGELRLIASPDGRDGSLTIHQDASLYLASLASGDRVRHTIEPGRRVWVQIAEGSVTIAGETYSEGDAAILENETEVTIEGASDRSETVVFDLP
ncbi:MAG: pirin family protein [Phycisphaerales bacterium JB037]